VLSAAAARRDTARWTAARWAAPRRAAALAGTAALAGLAVVGGAVPARADIVRDRQQWVLDAINVAGAWPVSQGAGVTVAVIDSGVDGDVPDLVGSVRAGPDLTGVGTSPDNPSWGMHGTWMASLIAGHGHDGGGSGIIGVAPGARILSIRVITDKGDPGYDRYQNQPNSRAQQELATGITDAVSDGASVISMSLGYSAPSRPVRLALQNAFAHNVVVVASSGNSGDLAGATGHGSAPVSFPANYPGVLGVGAVGSSGQAASFSSENLSVQVAAPGVAVPAQGRNSGYWTVSGTSPACALTAGVAALIKSKYPGLTDPQVSDAITTSTWHRPAGGYDQQVGFGTVNAAAALTAAGRMAAAGRGSPGGESVPASSHFSAGSAALPAAPLAPRGPLALVAYCLLGAACLIVMAVAALRLAAARQSPRGTRRAQPAYSGPAPSGPARTAVRREASPYGDYPSGSPRTYPPGGPASHPPGSPSTYPPDGPASYPPDSPSGYPPDGTTGYPAANGNGNGYQRGSTSPYPAGNGHGQGYPAGHFAPASQPARDYRPEARPPEAGPPEFRLPEARRPEAALPEARRPEAGPPEFRPPAARQPATAPLRPIPPPPVPAPPWAQPHPAPGTLGAAHPKSGPPGPPGLQEPTPAPPAPRRRDAGPGDGPPPGAIRSHRSSRSPGRHAAPAEPPSDPGDAR
jgi:type VII secretion-associated serine protease mycosin